MLCTTVARSRVHMSDIIAMIRQVREDSVEDLCVLWVNLMCTMAMVRLRLIANFISGVCRCGALLSRSNRNVWG